MSVSSWVISLAASVVAWSTVFCPERMDWIIALVVCLACTAPNCGVTGTDAPPSTICVAKGFTSGSSDSIAFLTSEVRPEK